MKQLALCLAPILAFVACGVDSSEVTETSPSHEEMNTAPSENSELTPGAGSPSLLGACSTRSPSPCAGATIGSVCHISPTRWCLPSNELPDGSILCGCQTQSTI